MRPELEGLPDPPWFHHGVQILALLEQHQPQVCVELGTHRGGSAMAQARVLQRWGGTLLCIDTWAGDVSMAACRAHLEQAGVTSVITLLQSDTVAAALHAPAPIDYLYVDADHSCTGVTRDLEAWWPLLTVGGLIAGDDYDDPHGLPSEGVTAAWDAFERAHGQAFQRTVSTDLIGCHCPHCTLARLIWGVKR